MGRLLKRIIIAALPLSALASAAGAQAFRPALLNDAAELAFIKGRIQAGSEPWKTAFDKLKAASSAKLDYAPKPRETVECGSYNVPNNGCTDESNDSKAAYAHALLFAFTGTAAHAAKSAAILDAWSSTLKAHTNTNAPLQSSWIAPLFCRAAVILRESYPAWDKASRDRFSALLNTAYLPLIKNGNPTYNGNWELSYIEALLSIGVFNGDTASFNKGVFLWRKRTPAYFYLKSDGPRPVKPYGTTKFDNTASFNTYWYDPQVWPEGLAQETCRDFGHTQMGLAAMANTAEIALHQGIDLYAGEADRIITGMEFHANLMLGAKPPAGLCKDSLNFSNQATWEIAYNHFHNRMGRELPFTRRLIAEKLRPTTTGTHMAWESLTHGELGKTLSNAILRPVRSRAFGELEISPVGTVFQRTIGHKGRSYMPSGRLLP